MYQALYRKYRPLVFTDVAGQRHVTDTLRAQSRAGRFSHAYLFTGTRGTGKTTCAKILARAANCLDPRNGDPCNECPNCLAALGGALTDITELDAASHTGVDNMREILEEAVFTPIQGKKRVYVIDETHMLSQGAFNALLKTLEEPPEHIMFILATTETHKVPATILSRCQRFAFRRLGEEDMAARLLEVAGYEKLQLTRGAAEIIARLADGAMRDALSLLDQAVVEGGVIDEAAVRTRLGLSGDDVCRDMTNALLSRDCSGALKIFGDALTEGRDTSAFIGELSFHIRDIAVDALKRGETRPDLINLLNVLQDALLKLPRAPRPRIEAELAIMKLCAGDTVITIKQAEKPVIKATPPPPPPAAPEKNSSASVNKDAFADALPPHLGAFVKQRETQLEVSGTLWTLGTMNETAYMILKDAAKELSECAAKLAGSAVTVNVKQLPLNERLRSVLF